MGHAAGDGDGEAALPGAARLKPGGTPRMPSHSSSDHLGEGSVWAVVLAAGRSSRFGAVKALMPVGSCTALEAVIAIARGAGASGVVVVTGHHREAVAPVVAASQAIECLNPDPDRGMMSSVRLGVARLPTLAAALVWPVDHPFVQLATVRQVMVALQTWPDPLTQPIVVPCYGGRGGHPTLFPAGLRSALLDLDDAGGPDRLLREHAERVLRLAASDPGVRKDVDRRGDLAGAPRRP